MTKLDIPKQLSAKQIESFTNNFDDYDDKSSSSDVETSIR